MADWERMEDTMEKNILVYNNRTGIAEKMAPLMIGEGFSVLVAADLDHL